MWSKELCPVLYLLWNVCFAVPVCLLGIVPTLGSPSCNGRVLMQVCVPGGISGCSGSRGLGGAPHRLRPPGGVVQLQVLSERRSSDRSAGVEETQQPAHARWEVSAAIGTALRTAV